MSSNIKNNTEVTGYPRIKHLIDNQNKNLDLLTRII